MLPSPDTIEGLGPYLWMQPRNVNSLDARSHGTVVRPVSAISGTFTGVDLPMRNRPRRRPGRQAPAPAPRKTTPAPPLPDAPVLPIVASKPWYHAGIQFGCTRCGACCRRKGFVWLSKPDITRLANHL